MKDAKELVDLPHTHLGNAERLLFWFGEDMKWISRMNVWMIWEGTRWVEDDTMQAMAKATQVIRVLRGAAIEMIADVADKDDPGVILRDFAKRSESINNLKAMVELMKALPGVCVTVDQFDAQPMLLNTNTGTIDLETGKLREHSRDDLISCIAPVDYSDQHICPEWDRFMDQIMMGDKDMVAYIQRLCGYAATGSVQEEICPFLYGHGANGKTTFIETIRNSLGDYGGLGSLSLIQKHHNSTADEGPVIARLRGKRLITTPEVAENMPLNENLLKEQVTVGHLEGRELYGKSFKFQATHLLMLYGNHKPTIKGTDNGIWRRLHLIKFELDLTEEDREKDLGARLALEGGGILHWIVQGCLAWQAEGLNPPKKVLAAVEEYREDSDVLGAFIHERLIHDEDCEGIMSSEIYEEYKEWTESNGMNHPLTNISLSRKLVDRGFVKRPRERGAFFLDWRLRLPIDFEVDVDEESDEDGLL